MAATRGKLVREGDVPLGGGSGLRRHCPGRSGRAQQPEYLRGAGWLSATMFPTEERPLGNADARGELAL